MGSKRVTVHCGKCNHEWDLPLKLPMPISQFTRTMRGYAMAGCSECGAHGPDVYLGPAVDRSPDAEPAAEVCTEP